MLLSLEHPLVQDFFSYLQLKNISSSTIREYRWALQSFFRFCPSHIESPHDVTTSLLREYVAGVQKRGLAPKTVNDLVTILKRLFGYLLLEGFLETESIRPTADAESRETFTEGFDH